MRRGLRVFELTRVPAHRLGKGPASASVLREALEPVAVVELEKTVALLDEQRADGYCELRSDRPPEGALPHLGISPDPFRPQYAERPDMVVPAFVFGAPY